jgi:nucleoside-diphosphate kinase
MKEKTLLLIKPDAVKRNIIGKILHMVEENGFVIKGIKMEKMSIKKAESFYAVHKGKEFFEKLVKYITEDKVVAVLLEREKAVELLRELIGNTDPAKARPGTIRFLFGIDITRNTVHASDSRESFEYEVRHFFDE